MRDGVVAPQTRPASRLRFPPLACRCLDLGIKPRIAQRLILIQGQPYVVDRLFVQLRAEEIPVGGLPVLCAPAQRQIQRMRGDAVVALSQGMVAIARPAVMRRIVDHRRPYGVELNVSLTGQQVGFGLDQRGFVPAIPQSAAPTVGGVDVLHVAPPQGDD